MSPLKTVIRQEPNEVLQRLLDLDLRCPMCCRPSLYCKCGYRGVFLRPSDYSSKSSLHQFSSSRQRHTFGASITTIGMSREDVFE